MHHRACLAFSIALASVGLAACGDVPPQGAPTLGTLASTNGAHAVVWGPCPDGSGYLTEPTAECATLDMPIDHAHPKAGTIPFFVARMRSGVPDAPQLWILDGGPGSSGEEFFDLQVIEEYAWFAPTADIYIPAHRGTGYSAGLFCSGEAPGTPRDTELSPAEWQACAAEMTAAWGSKLALFDMTQAAADVGEAIDRLRPDGRPVFVYGLSYGTSLALRYLHAYPHQASGVILDSVVSPGAEFQSEADTYFDPVLQRYASLCAADAGCAARMGPDPVAKIAGVFGAIDAGHCAEAGIDRPTLWQILAGSLMGWNARTFALAVPYRLDRCTPEDVTALHKFTALWFAPPYSTYGFSHALEANISFSEIWESPAPSPATLVARAEGALASFDWTLERAGVYGYWPKYTPSIDPNAWPDTSVPMLMLNGTLDGETPIELASLAGEHFDRPHQTFVTLPNSPHGAGYQSPTDLPDVPDCGLAIMGSFMANPKGAPDTSCIAHMLPLAFENKRFARVFFGTGSLWDNTPPSPAPPPDAAPAVVRRGRGQRALVIR
jgi:pimeloyl-ACP methyl ester carboxylesterase